MTAALNSCVSSRTSAGHLSGACLAPFRRKAPFQDDTRFALKPDHIHIGCQGGPSRTSLFRFKHSPSERCCRDQNPRLNPSQFLSKIDRKTEVSGWPLPDRCHFVWLKSK